MLRDENLDMTFFPFSGWSTISVNFIQLSCIDGMRGSISFKIFITKKAGVPAKRRPMEAVDANTIRLTLLDTVAENGCGYRLHQKTAAGHSATHPGTICSVCRESHLPYFLIIWDIRNSCMTHGFGQWQGGIIYLKAGRSGEQPVSISLDYRSCREMMREGYGDLKSVLSCPRSIPGKGLKYHTRVYLVDNACGGHPFPGFRRGCVPDSPEANAMRKRARLYLETRERRNSCMYLPSKLNLTSAFSGEVFEKPSSTL